MVLPNVLLKGVEACEDALAARLATGSNNAVPRLMHILTEQLRDASSAPGVWECVVCAFLGVAPRSRHL